MGIAASFFLFCLDYATSLHQSFPALIFGLPLLAVLTSYTYKKYGKKSIRGNNLVIDSIHQQGEIPLILAPLVFFFTILSHVFGASVGREGTAVQMGGSISDFLVRSFNLDKSRRKGLLLAGVSAGFGAVFGTPWAGMIFGLEMSEIGKIQWKSLLSCFIASFLANTTALFLHTQHHRYTIESLPSFNIRLLLLVLLLALLIGLIARLFAVSLVYLKSFYQKVFKQDSLRSLVAALILLVFLLLLRSHSYEGLSTWMISAGFKGEASFYDPVFKFITTLLSLGAGFQGGEATPLFDIGASLGGLLGQSFDLEPSFMAALGYVCLFSSAANIPLTGIVLGVELFGWQYLPYFALVAVLAYYIVGHHSIYRAQRIHRSKRLNRPDLVSKPIEWL